MEDDQGEGPELDRQDGAPNVSYWDVDRPAPQNKASLLRWNRYSNTNATVLEQELFPISATITGNIAVVQYSFSIARENYNKDRETVTGRYTDVLVKEGGRWLFLAWAGGGRPQEVNPEYSVVLRPGRQAVKNGPPNPRVPRTHGLALLARLTAERLVVRRT